LRITHKHCLAHGANRIALHAIGDLLEQDYTSPCGQQRSVSTPGAAAQPQRIAGATVSQRGTCGCCCGAGRSSKSCSLQKARKLRDTRIGMTKRSQRNLWGQLCNMTGAMTQPKADATEATTRPATPCTSNSNYVACRRRVATHDRSV